VTAPRGRKTVLVVDDEVEIRESLEEALQDEGYDVVVAANGREAMLALPRLARPCAVVLDIIMPFMSGAEVYAAMRIDPGLADIPVVVSTSDPSRAPAGALLMKKPIHLDRLLETIAGLF
jgi:two-component system, sensor histidine kinase and response regulator